MTTQNNDIEQEKQDIEELQEIGAEEIVEIDEAAGSAEGLTDRSDHPNEDTKEDREITHDVPLDVPESEITR